MSVESSLWVNWRALPNKRIRQSERQLRNFMEDEGLMVRGETRGTQFAIDLGLYEPTTASRGKWDLEKWKKYISSYPVRKRRQAGGLRYADLFPIQNRIPKNRRLPVMTCGVCQAQFLQRGDIINDVCGQICQEWWPLVQKYGRSIIPPEKMIQIRAGRLERVDL